MLAIWLEAQGLGVDSGVTSGLAFRLFSNIGNIMKSETER